MPVVRRINVREQSEPDPIDVFTWSASGTDHVLGGAHYATRAEAERAWRKARRTLWAKTHRYDVPRAARFHDRLTALGPRAVRDGWNHKTIDLARMLDAIGEDRRNLAAFEARDPRGARAVGDYLEKFREDLATAEQAARDLAARGGPPWQRTYPAHLHSGRMYGD